MNKKTIITTLVAMILCCSTQADARIFGRRKAAANNCPDGICQQPTTQLSPNSGLTINHNGGFEGQLTDAYYQSYTGRVDPPAVAVAVAVAEKSIVVKRTVLAMTTVEQAKADLADAQDAVYEAQLAIERAESEVRKNDAIANAEAQKAASIRIAEIEAEIRNQDIAREAKQRELSVISSLKF